MWRPNADNVKKTDFREFIPPFPPPYKGLPAQLFCDPINELSGDDGLSDGGFFIPTGAILQEIGNGDG